MLNMVGQLKERLGKAVNKIILLRKIGQTERVYDVEIESGGRMTCRDTKIRYCVVKQHYFGSKETLWKFDKEHTYELHLDEVAYVRGQTSVQFKDFDSGASLGIGGGEVIARRDPVTLTRLVGIKHLNTFADSVKSTSPQLVGVLIGLLVAAPMFFMIGQNWEAIVEAIRGVVPHALALL